MGRKTMRKGLLGITLSIVTAMGISSAMAEMTAGESRLYQAAKAEKPAIWYTAHYTTETSEALTKAFAEKYPGLSVDVVRSTGGVAYQRLQQELTANQLQGDIFSNSDINQYRELRQQGYLAKYRPENFDKVVDAYKGIYEDDHYLDTSIAYAVIVYNNAKVSAANAPKSWKDFIDAKWKGKSAISHPGFSGTSAHWFAAMEKLFGRDFMQKLADNAPHVGRSSFDPISNVISGERLIGVAISSSALALAAKGNPITVVYPEEGIVLFRGRTAILAGSDSPNTARLFVNFLLGIEANEILAKEYWEVTRQEVKPAPGMQSLDSIKKIDLTPEEIVKGTPEAVATFRDAFGI
jgi:iron(III) transport system substrate-binding protein